MKCSICLDPMYNLKHMQNHINKVHNVTEYENFVCNQNCTRIFNSIKSLYRHIKTEHCSLKVSNIVVNENSEAFVSNDIEDVQYSTPEYENVENSNTSIKQAELSFILKLYRRLNLTRKDVEGIVMDVITLLNIKMPERKHFEGLQTEYLVKKILVDKGLYIEPEQFIVGFDDDGVQRNKSQYELISKPQFGQYVPLDKLFLKIFTNPSILDAAIEYMNMKSLDQITDLKDGSAFCSLDENMLPYVLYYDDVECGNALGSHKGFNKIGAIYMSFRCFPTHQYSKLKNIYVCSIFPANGRNNVLKVIQKLIPSITSLYKDGLVIYDKQIRFKFCGILGDNLATHQFLGFTESFSANYYCRFCKAQKSVCQKMTKQDDSLMRNIENYSNDIERELSETGISRDSLLNSIPDYHVTENYFVDAMHDTAEGVASFGMLAVINYFVSHKVLSIDVINERIKLFPYMDISNVPPPVTKNHLNKGALAYSASEMINLVLYFCLMVGDLIDKECQVWKYYLTLRELVDLILLKMYSKDHSKYLSVIIDEHHSMYKHLFQVQLKPKHHFLLHYPSILLKSGPFSNNWSMRFESKHTLMKTVANVMKSRVNLCKSLTIRHMFLLSSQFFDIRYNLMSDLTVGPKNKFGGYRYVHWKGVKYSIGDIVWTATDDDTSLPIFDKILNIIISDSETILNVKRFETLYLYEHYAAYAVKKSNSVHDVPIVSASRPMISVFRENILLISSTGIA